eukprot:CAMPEP_0197544030 /NCGR_PEP_ID=MMETSP1318-20131121/68555_1 /TAXON_ID=552666 /ORGANISM="Partenskyella glossopodia, Strain RCC365" /LENGTH=266 /DNA_ID=CAMNT_0043103405 /DNA_START=898 /DNA_END=1698 /DNA_ORIENTATION=-
MIESFKFEFKGLTGLILDDKQRTRPYSLLSVTWAMPEGSRSPNSFAVRWIQATVFCVSFLAPLLHMFVLMILWWVPMTARPQYFVFAIAEVLNAWSALDVFVISIIASILELEQFAAFMVGSKCDFIQPFIEKYLKRYLNGYDECFTVVATLSDGCWVLFTAVIVSWIVAQAVMRMCHIAMFERLADIEQHHYDNTQSIEAFIEENRASRYHKRRLTSISSIRTQDLPGQSKSCGTRLTKVFMRMGLLKMYKEIHYRHGSSHTHRH